MKPLEKPISAFMQELLLEEEEISRSKKLEVLSNGSLFEVKTANDWMEDAQQTAAPKMLFSEMWHEGELCVLYADTNLGKSLLAVQIGNSIATGKSIPGFKLE